MIHKIISLASAGLLLATSVAHAQKNIYSLEQVWQKALQHYPSISSAKFQAEKQRLNKQLVNKQHLPEVNFQGQQSYGSYQSVPGSFFPLAGNYNTNGGDKRLPGDANAVFNVYASAVAQWNFLDFGKITAQSGVADAAIKLGEATLSREQFKIQIAATQQYFDVLRSSALLTNSKADAKRLYDLLELARAQADAGLRPGADTLLVKAAFLQAKTLENDQQAQMEAAMWQLSSFIAEGVDSFTVNDSIYEVSLKTDTSPVQSVSEHPYLNYLKAAMLYANASLASVKREPYPTVALLAGAGVRGSGLNGSDGISNSLPASWNNSVGNYLVGVGVTWKLSSLYESRLKEKMAVKEIESAGANYEEGRLQLEASYRAAVSRWTQKRNKLSTARLAMDASRMAYDLYVTRYENGLLSLIELLQLQKNLQDAEASVLKATGDYWNELIQQSENSGNLQLLLSQINQ